MALVIEDGTGVAGADSYITVAEYNAWINARITTHTDTDAVVESRILRAMDYFEALDFKGSKQSSTQALQFPRYNLMIDGYPVYSDTIPDIVKKALYEIVYADERGYGLFADVARKTKREKVDVLEVEYSDSSASRVMIPAAAAYLRKLIKSSNVVSRA